MRKYHFISLAIIVIIAVGACGASRPTHSASSPSSATAQRAASGASYTPGRPVPATAAAAAHELVTGTEAEQHSALSPALAAVLPQGAMFPAGSTIALTAGSWHQAGGYANATGTLSEPGASTKPVEIGFASSGGTWLVTFEEPLS